MGLVWGYGRGRVWVGARVGVGVTLTLTLGLTSLATLAPMSTDMSTSGASGPW